MGNVLVVDDKLMVEQNEHVDSLIEAAMCEAETFYLEHRRDGLWLRFEANTRRERGVQCMPCDPFGAIFELTYANRLEHLMFHADNDVEGWA